MKKHLMTGILACMLMFGAKALYAQTVPLDTAINNVADEFSNNLKKGSKIAILAVRSSSARMSKYIIEELTSVFVNQRLVTVVDSAQLDQLQVEMNYQITGEISNASAQAIGKRVDAQSVITGSFEMVGNYYRFRVRIIEVETAAILVIHSANVQNDQVVASLMNSGTSPSASVATTTPQENYEDFTGSQRFGTWALNAFTVPGLGSIIIMKDKVGFRNQLIMGLSAPLLLVVGEFLIMTSQVYVYDGYGIPNNSHYRIGKQETFGVITMGLGGIMYLVNGVYNIVRSSTYHKPQSTALLFDPTAINIVLLPARDGSIDKVRLSYTMRF